ncbi:ATP-binding protein [Hippea alviniae]|uniref:ATP-binding protein n=1 Tax=Hippea alviniae TaxID=1279027 RepID=UPI0003B56B23|nr:ATP-binding protein [Hippea alviniae]
MKLETYYNPKAISLIRNFVSEAANFYGANSKERYALELASEEAANHIISNYPKFFKDTFEIFIETEPESKIFRIIMINKGIPVNKNGIPEYKPENLKSSPDGLQFYLIKKLADNFKLINCGKEGWKTIIEKRLENFKDPLKSSFKETTVEEIPALDNVNFRLAEAEDSYEITKLAYLTYKYSYGRSMFYYPEVLKESIENREVISLVAETQDKQIIAHTAYVKSRNGEGIYESVALMARPEVRRTRIVAKLLKFQYEYSMKNSDRIKVAEAELVTGHTSSQKIASIYGFLPFALFVSYYDQNEFIGINIPKNRQRETILYALRPSKEPIKSTIFSPKEHEQFLKEIYSGDMFDVSVKTEATNDLEEKTLYSTIKRRDMSLGTIIIKTMGKDWFDIIKSVSKEIKFDGFKTIFVRILADKPLPENLEEYMNSLGFFLSGTILGPIDKWSLLYIQPINQKIDWDEIKLYDKRAVKLKEYVKENQLKVYNLI